MITCMAIPDHQHDREDPHKTGPRADSFRLVLKPLRKWCAQRTYLRYFYPGLEIPMAVTSASNCIVEHGRMGALSEGDRASERNQQITEVDVFFRPVDESANCAKSDTFID